MLTSLATDQITPFIRQGLGCGCPDSVFEQLADSREQLNGIHFQRLLAGDRLLVYLVLEAPDFGLEKGLSDLLQRGLRERDSAGYNRLRIVWPQGETLQAAFERQTAGDEKAHFHPLSLSELAIYGVQPVASTF